jgi:hypothetical protein
MTTPMLKQLDSLVADLPASLTKHDLEPAYEVMATWVRELQAHDRAELLAELPIWLQEDHPWHSRAAVEMAVRLPSRELLQEAVREANRRGVVDLAAGLEYPPWLSYQLHLLSGISRCQGDPGEQAWSYLRELRAGALQASSYSRRLLGIRAWFTECLLEADDRRGQCLVEGMELLRKWHDPRLSRSGLTLLHAYFAAREEGLADLRAVLTREEFEIACPEVVEPN